MNGQAVRSKSIICCPKPQVRHQFTFLLDLTEGCIYIVAGKKVEPAQQPAFDKPIPTGKSHSARDTKRRRLVALVHAATANLLGGSLPIPICADTMRSFDNHAFLAGESLPGLVHPTFPIALVL
jgi:ribosomal protein L28